MADQELPTRPAHIGDLLTVYTDVMCAPNGFPAIKRLIGFMIDRNLLRHQWIRGVVIVKPALAEQFPWLAEITPPNFTGIPREERAVPVREWVNEQAARYGPVHHVRRLPDGVWEDRDPVEEYRAMGGQGLIGVMPLPDGRVETFSHLEPGVLHNPRFDPTDPSMQ